METLASKIAQDQALTELDATGWIIRLAKGLEPIHALGVAHGNISAEALRIGGASRASRGFLAGARGQRDLAAYHSPERARGEGPSVEDDTWAVCVTLYFALTGAVPFPGADDSAVRARILGAPASPLAVFDVGDDGLQQILDRAFARELSQRLTSVRELRELLEEWHPDPEVKDLAPLDDDDDDAATSAPAPALQVGRAQAARGPARPPVPSTPAPPPVAEMSAQGLLAASDDEDGPTQVRGDASVHQYLAALQASPGPVSLARTGANVAAPGALGARASRLRKLPAPTPPPLKRPPSIAPGPLPPLPPAPLAAAPLAAAPLESKPPSRAGLATAGLFDDEEPTLFAPSLVQGKEASPPASGAAPAPMFPVTPAPEAIADAPTHSSRSGPSSASQRGPASSPQSAPVSVSEAAPTLAISGGSPAVSERIPAGPVSKVPSSAATPAPVVKAEPPPAPAEALAPSSEPAFRTRSRAPLLGVLGLLVTGGLAAFFLFGPRSPTEGSGSAGGASGPTPSSTSPTSSAAVVPPPATSPALPGATSSAAASSSAAPSASTSASAAPVSSSPGAVAACLLPMFASGTFTEPPLKLGSICGITDPRKGGETVRIEVILGSTGRGSSEGMHEWGVLGLYEIAAFSILRAACCPSPAPLHIPIDVPTCDIETPLKKLAEVAASPSSSDADVTAALTAYTTQARCISRAGAATAFGQKTSLQGGELETFQKTLDRARAAVKRK